MREVYRYVSKDSPSRARQLCDHLIAATERLKTHPYSGPLLPEDPAYRQLVVDGFRIVYRVASDTVFVMPIVCPGMRHERAL